MKITNVSKKEQKIRLCNLTGGEDFTIYLSPGCSTDLEDSYLADRRAYVGVLLFDEEGKNNKAIGTKNGEPVRTIIDKSQTQKPILEDFTCDICGKKFDTKHGLVLHRSKAHPKK